MLNSFSRSFFSRGAQWVSALRAGAAESKETPETRGWNVKRLFSNDTMRKAAESLPYTMIEEIERIYLNHTNPIYKNERLTNYTPNVWSDKSQNAMPFYMCRTASDYENFFEKLGYTTYFYTAPTWTFFLNQIYGRGFEQQQRGGSDIPGVESFPMRSEYLDVESAIELQRLLSEALQGPFDDTRGEAYRFMASVVKHPGTSVESGEGPVSWMTSHHPCAVRDIGERVIEKFLRGRVRDEIVDTTQKVYSASLQVLSGLEAEGLSSMRAFCIAIPKEIERDVVLESMPFGRNISDPKRIDEVCRSPLQRQARIVFGKPMCQSPGRRHIVFDLFNPSQKLVRAAAVHRVCRRAFDEFWTREVGDLPNEESRKEFNHRITALNPVLSNFAKELNDISFDALSMGAHTYLVSAFDYAKKYTGGRMAEGFRQHVKDLQLPQFHQGDLDEAQQHFTEHETHTVNDYVGLALISFLKGDINESQSEILSSMDSTQSPGTAMRPLIEMILAHGPEKVEECAEEFLQQEGNQYNPVGVFFRGLAAFAQGNLKAAHEDFDRLHKYFPIEDFRNNPDNQYTELEVQQAETFYHRIEVFQKCLKISMMQQSVYSTPGVSREEQLRDFWGDVTSCHLQSFLAETLGVPMPEPAKENRVISSD